MTSRPFTITTWGPERPQMTFTAATAAEAYELVLNKAVYASLQVRVTRDGQELTLDELAVLIEQKQ